MCITLIVIHYTYNFPKVFDDFLISTVDNNDLKKLSGEAESWTDEKFQEFLLYKMESKSDDFTFSDGISNTLHEQWLEDFEKVIEQIEKSDNYHVSSRDMLNWENEPLAFNPARRTEIWRYLTYQLVHSSHAHLWINVALLILAGTPLELVHDGYIVYGTYIAGSIMGCMINYWVSHNFLVGASAGVYSVLFLHISNFIINGDVFEAKYIIIQFLLNLPLLALMLYDIIKAFIDPSGTKSYVSHLAGIFTAFTLGIGLLRNFYIQKWESSVRRWNTISWGVVFLMFFLVQFKSFTYSPKISSAGVFFRGVEISLDTSIPDEDIGDVLVKLQNRLIGLEKHQPKDLCINVGGRGYATTIPEYYPIDIVATFFNKATGENIEVINFEIQAVKQQSICKSVSLNLSEMISNTAQVYYTLNIIRPKDFTELRVTFINSKYGDGDAINWSHKDALGFTIFGTESTRLLPNSPSFDKDCISGDLCTLEVFQQDLCVMLTTGTDTDADSTGNEKIVATYKYQNGDVLQILDFDIPGPFSKGEERKVCKPTIVNGKRDIVLELQIQHSNTDGHQIKKLETRLGDDNNNNGLAAENTKTWMYNPGCGGCSLIPIFWTDGNDDAPNGCKNGQLCSLM